MDLISREVVLEKVKHLKSTIKECAYNDYYTGYVCALSGVEGMLAHQPTVDAAPVVKGEWIEKLFLMGTSNICSICGSRYGMPHEKYNFCPNCGADMRKGGAE